MTQIVRERTFLTTAGLLSLWWALIVHVVSLPTAFRPWGTVWDLSQWELIQTFSADHWSVRHDLRFPPAGSAALRDQGDFSFTVPIVQTNALLKVKVRPTVSHQRLRLVLNNREVAAFTATAPGSVHRWRSIIPGRDLRVGRNTLTLIHEGPVAPIEVEKVQVGNVYRSYPAQGGSLILDGAGHPLGQWQVLVMLGGLLSAGIGVILMLLAFSATDIFSTMHRWCLAPPVLVLIGLTGLVIVSLVTPYTACLEAFRVWDAWNTAWSLSVGLALSLMILSMIRRLRTADPRVVTEPLFRTVKVGWVITTQVSTAVLATLTRVGTSVRHLVDQRWVSYTVCGAVFLMAAGTRGLYFLLHPSDTLVGSVNSGGDAEVYLRTAVEVMRRQPFLIGLFHYPYFPNLHSVWNCQVAFSTFLAGFFRVWGFYPGLVYWGWTMVVLSSLLCLIPYAWQRLWGYSGVGGLAVGFLFATSLLMTEDVVKPMTDLLGLILLGGAFWFLGRLATRARWADVIVMSVLMTVLALSRTANMYIDVFLLAGLLIAWWRLTPDRAIRSDRFRKFWGLVALWILGLALAEVGLLAGNMGWRQSYFGILITKQLVWGVQNSSHDPLGLLYPNLLNPVRTMWRDHPIWVIVMPVCVWFSIWCLRQRRSQHAMPCLLVTVAWLGYAGILSLGSPWPRYTMPWLFFQGLFVAQLVDVAWERLRAVLKTPLLWGAASLGALLIFSPLALASGRTLLSEWRQYSTQREQATAYLTLAAQHLPPTAIVLVMFEVAPWDIARQLQRTTAYAGITCHYGLLFDPRQLDHHPYTLVTETEEEVQATIKIFGHPTGRFIRRCLSMGKTVWFLDRVVDPQAPRFFQNAVTGFTGHIPAGYYTVQSVDLDPNQEHWKLFQITPIVRTHRP